MKKFFHEENLIGFGVSVVAGVVAVWVVFKILPVSLRQKIVGA